MQFIVHSSFFSKSMYVLDMNAYLRITYSSVLFSLAGAIISPKFFRKIAYIDTLSSLACHVPLTQIDISPAVYSYVHSLGGSRLLLTPLCAARI